MVEALDELGNPIENLDTRVEAHGILNMTQSFPFLYLFWDECPLGISLFPNFFAAKICQWRNM